jgi:hypothetical protein
MSLKAPALVSFVAVCIAVSSVSAANSPAIGAGSRFQADELVPGWHRGFLNQIRTVPPCYIVMIFEERTSPDASLRVKLTIPIARLHRLQVTDAPGASMQEWNGLTLSPVSEGSWQDIDLTQLRLREGKCKSEDLLSSEP